MNDFWPSQKLMTEEKKPAGLKIKLILLKFFSLFTHHISLHTAGLSELNVTIDGSSLILKSPN